ncbi:helicase [Planktothrix sp. FACHB-1355]|uniref:Helicase n=1 Tax=Aerosakkonema funiforme FACHB-1375 TaxID=2949571 RepID=A0A926VJB9_9CYAN|nr:MULTISPECIES: type ISP restriction/modification enzyme [Oscillatoriales]MBD2184693.1 helicase [Aerosakkonema funiforme FACHB-1375]MBD3559590.1 helicase [Planktothrix sp. FACHB-1355]
MAKIYHADLWGSREDKYRYLQEHDITTIEWTEIFPQSPLYLFIPQDKDLRTEYEAGWKITEIMPVNSTGVKTHRDHFVFDFDLSELQKRIEKFRDLNISDREISETYELQDTRDWKLSQRRRSLKSNSDWESFFTQCLYRPFDWRAYYHHEDVVELPRYEVTRHLLEENNLSLCTTRQVNSEFKHIFCTKYPVTDCTVSVATRERTYLFPLYLYPDPRNSQKSLFESNEIETNLAQKFVHAIREKLGYIPTPEAIFYYIYAIFHSPTYRQRYAEFLKIDFPRVPLTSSDRLFKDLGAKGEALVDLHLMKSKKLNKLITKMDGDGDNAVTEVTYKPAEQRIYINRNRYFEGITPNVWEFNIGGYQVLDKWLKDRKKARRTLSFDDVLHYQKVVIALKETMQIMQEIDRLIPGFPIE